MNFADIFLRFNKIRFCAKVGYETCETSDDLVMRKEMKPSSFRMWRERVQGRATKHAKKRTPDLNEESRFKCTRQRSISNNKISKRK